MTRRTGFTITTGAITRGALTRGALTRGALKRGAITTGALTAGLLALPALTATGRPLVHGGLVLASRAQRQDALAALDRFQSRLLAAPSATATLARWCADHRLAPDPRIIATVLETPPVAPTPAQRARLGVGPDEPVAYRRVRLRCGETVLSEAENWYVPARLTPAMNAALADRRTPFGTAIAALGPRRQTLAAERLWPAPEAEPETTGAKAAGPETTGAKAAGTAPVAGPEPLDTPVLRARALVVDGAGRPLAEVSETYRLALLGFLGAD